jgi:hypothetical protein
MPLDAAIELRFDRFLLPSTAVRQSLRVFLRYPDIGVFLEPHYDLVERVVSYRPPSGLWAPNTLYTVEVVVPTEEESEGFRAFDGAPLEHEAADRTWTFRTAAVAPTGSVATPRPSCTEILDLFATLGCVACHAGAEAAAGMRLESIDALIETSFRRVARQTETGTHLGEPQVAPSRFGRQMPRIDPGNPGNSYLLYKLLVHPAALTTNDDVCHSRYAAPVGPECIRVGAAEVERLRDAFVRWDPMPPTSEPAPTDAIRSIADYIAAGASTSGCR